MRFMAAQASVDEDLHLSQPRMPAPAYGHASCTQCPLGSQATSAAILGRFTKDLDMANELEGGCLCGNVRFRTSQAPIRTLACHCTFCQRMTGTSYFAESTFPKDEVTFNSGRMNCYEHISEGSKKKVFVHFCINCGTTVTLTFERWPDMRAISRGCFDDPNAVEVTSHIWTQSAQSGTALPEGVECFAGARMSLAGQAEPSTRHVSPVMARQNRDA